VASCKCCSGPLKKTGFYTNRNNRVQRFRCLRCDATFSEAQPLQGVVIETAKAAQVVSMLFEGIGINAIARLTGLAKNTVLNVLTTAGEHCERFMQANVRNVKAECVQVDELYSYVARHPSFVEAGDPDKGEFYCYLSIERKTKLVINHLIGKRTGEDCLIFMEELKARTNGRFTLASDGYAGYVGHLGAVFQTFKNEIDYGTEVKQFGPEFAPVSSKGRASRKFNKKVCKWVRRTPRIGEPEHRLINTSHAERLNLTMRLFNRRFTRCTLGYSKKLLNHRLATAIFVCLYNFCRIHSATKATPAHAAGLTDRTWTVEELLSDITNSFKTISVGTNILSEVECVYEYIAGLPCTLKLQEIDGVSPVTSTTTWTYSTAMDGSSNLVQSVTYPDGNWSYYQYDSLGRKTNEFDAYGNSPAPAVGTVPDPSTLGCKQIQYFFFITNSDGTTNSVYTPDPENAFSPMETVVSVPEAAGGSWVLQEVSRSYDISSSGGINDTKIQCPIPGSLIDDPHNLSTDTLLGDGTGGHTFGLPYYITYPNGTYTSFYYSSVAETVEDDPDGTQIVKTVDGWGKIQSVAKSYYGLTIQDDVYTYTDPLERSYYVTDLAGRTTSYVYDCCNLDSMVDPDGVTNEYTYDLMKRRVASSVYYGGPNPITTTNTIDGAGRTLKTQRIGTDSNSMTLQTTGYDVLGRAIARTNALGGVTTSTYSADGSPQCVTNVNPDGGTLIQAGYADERMESVSGTAAMPVEYVYGAVQDAGGPWRESMQTIKLNSSGGTNEWTASYTDGAGRAYKTVYSTSSGSNPFDELFYNSDGQLERREDADGISTLYQYNGYTGVLEFTAVDINQNGTIDWSGPDRITQVERTAIYSGEMGNSQAWTSYQFLDGQSTGTPTSCTTISANGLTNWQMVYPDGVTAVTTSTEISPGTNRTQTTVAPDGSYAISLYSYGRLASVNKYGSSGTNISQTSYAYDAHGRQYAVTDARNGSTVYQFNDADQVISVTTPNPGSIPGAPQTTANSYDTQMRPTGFLYADGTSLTNVYYPTGLIQSNYGSRAYPVGYGYDAQGRMTTMTNWSDFAANSGQRVTTWVFDPYRGFLTNKTDAANQAVSYTFTGAGRLASRLWARGTNTTYLYNTAGDLGTNFYSDGTPGVTNAYNRLGQKTNVMHGATSTSFVYDLANDMLSESNSGGVLNGLMVSNQFDAYLRRTNMALLNGNTPMSQAIYGYDNASRLAVVSDGTNSAAYSYLAFSPLVGQITFANSGTTEMTTSKQYDYLNRLTSIASSASNAFTYQYNSANQRNLALLADGSYWRYGYDALGQVTSGNKYWSDETPVAGQQFGYTFDTIGNRTETESGGDQTGANLRVAYYTNNTLNQITSRSVPGYVDIMGDAIATNAVTVNGVTAYRKTEYFREQSAVTNTSAVWDGVTVVGSGQTNTGHIYVPETPENYAYDADGNLLSDGRWNYTWDGENRLTNMTSLSGAPTGSRLQLAFAYDYQGRRIQKAVSTNSGGGSFSVYTNVFAYDGWNLLAEVGTSGSLVRGYLWGTDLSGSLQGAGGVGGLIEVTYYGTTTTNCFVAHDGNGNVSALFNAADGTILANYEYGPFGETIRETGPMAKLNPVGSSDKIGDPETGLVCYGYRFYNPSTGRWLSKDPVYERGFKAAVRVRKARNRADLNLYGFVGNRPLTTWDYLGLESASGGTPTTSLVQHNNYLSFAVTCPVCQTIANVTIDYSKVMAALGGLQIGQWALADIFDTPDFTAANLGGLRNVQTPNCDGQSVTVTAYMRSRIVNSIWLELLTTPPNNPDWPGDVTAAQIIAAYVGGTTINYQCIPCGGSMSPSWFGPGDGSNPSGAGFNNFP
jgi:RHS repeat-associated protein